MGPRLFRRGNPVGKGTMKTIKLLQWGHVFSDVEIGNIADGADPQDRRFNGATSFQTWKFLPDKPCRDRNQQLQWGHVFSDVEMPRAAFAPLKPFFLLQWGHVFSDVEIRFKASDLRHPVHASMGPRLFRRGN